MQRTESLSPSQSSEMVKAVVLGAAGGIGQPLSLVSPPGVCSEHRLIGWLAAAQNQPFGHRGMRCFPDDLARIEAHILRLARPV